MFVVSISGGIGAGKTAVSNRFAALGIKVVDADVAAREVVRPGSEALHEIEGRFGRAVIDANGALDRAALRSIVFTKREERLWLEQLLHPRIGEYMRHELTTATSPYAIVVSPLMTGRTRGELATRTLVVDAPEAAQLRRTMVRDTNSDTQVKAIMATQATRAERLAQADDIIVNDSDFAALDTAVARLHARYLELARQATHVES